jgi:hypothetical protein
MFWRRPTVSASEFALLVAIPLTQGEFADDARHPTDFVRAYAASNGCLPSQAWCGYEPYARLCGSVVDEVERWGVNVARRATLGSLTDAVSRYQTVTLVAHSRGPEIIDGDLIDVTAVATAASSLTAVLGLPKTLSHNPTTLAASLNGALGPEDVESAVAMPDTKAFAWRTALYRQRWERRRMLEAACGDAIGGGPAIEFHDGLAPIEVVRDRLPRFVTLDLTVCDSVLLAECIRERQPHGIILANPRPTTPDFRLALYRETVRLATRHRLPYADAMIRIRRQLQKDTA